MASKQRGITLMCFLLVLIVVGLLEVIAMTLCLV
jgi:Tfp pilus assembly protein PilX